VFTGGGSGLGLFITNAIVQKHDGSVGFESEGLGHGCNFFFTIPVFRSTETLLPPGEPSLSTATAATLKSPLVGSTVLICDDSGLARKMLNKVLLGMGVKHCYEAKNGLEAVKMIEDRLKTGDLSSSYDVLPAFDFILMDDQMPKMQGPEATRRIRELGYSKPIIGVTGNLASEDVENFITCGADAVLSKPLEISKLVQILRQSETFKLD
jgi:CheY-like chemotaxis protein